MNKTSVQHDKIAEVNLRLREQGFIITSPSKSNVDKPRFDLKPIPAKGKPASEIIIEDRE